MEAGEYGLTRVTCFVAHRLEVVAVAGYLWISWCVLGAAGFISCVFFSKTHTACCKYEDALPHLPLLVMTQGRGSEATETVFAFSKKASS